MVQRRLKTHCDNGHEFTPANTYDRPGGEGRSCRACARIRAHEKTRREQEERAKRDPR